MAADAVIETRIDGAVKAQAAAVLEEMGLTLSDAVRILVGRIAREGAPPFDLRRPNAETLEAMRELEREEGVRFSSVEALMADLHADD